MPVPHPPRCVLGAVQPTRPREEATITLLTVDADGVPLRHGGAVITARVAPSGVASVADNHDGTYSISYTLNVTGAHELALKLVGVRLPSGKRQSLPPSPFAPVALLCELSDAVTATAVVSKLPVYTPAGVPLRFRVTAASSAPTVELRPCGAPGLASAVKATVRAGDGGAWDVSLTPLRAGDFYLSIAADGTACGGSPHLLHVRAGTPDLESSTCTCKAPSPLLRHRPAAFELRLRDAHGNAVGVAPNLRAELMQLRPRGEAKVWPAAILPVCVVDGAEEHAHAPTHEVRLVPVAAGPHALRLSLVGEGAAREWALVVQ